MNILVIGSSGMLGHVTTLYLRKLGNNVKDISKTNKINENTILLDILAKDALPKDFLTGFDAVINCAALLVGASEKNKSEAVLLNSWFPHMLESMLINTSTKIIQISTDGVFSGNNAPYFEPSLPDTPTFYGKTKLLGELNNDKDLTVRASFVGPDLQKEGTSLFNWFAMRCGNVEGYSEVYFNAVTNLEFAKFIDRALKSNISGIYHLGASEIISKLQFLRKVQRQFELTHITVTDNDKIKSNHALKNMRNEFDYVPKSYSDMLNELSDWMYENRYLYNHYDFL